MTSAGLSGRLGKGGSDSTTTAARLWVGRGTIRGVEGGELLGELRRRHSPPSVLPLLQARSRATLHSPVVGAVNPSPYASFPHLYYCGFRSTIGDRNTCCDLPAHPQTYSVPPATVDLITYHVPSADIHPPSLCVWGGASSLNE
jgi:hypothetical protein